MVSKFCGRLGAWLRRKLGRLDNKYDRKNASSWLPGLALGDEHSDEEKRAVCSVDSTGETHLALANRRIASFVQP